MKLVRTGKFGPFINISIGAVFFAHDKFWTRIDYDAGITLAASDAIGSACNFLIDGTVRGRNGELCERVELVEIEPETA